MNDNVFKSMPADHTLNAGPQEIVTDESIGIKKRRSAKSLIIGAVVILGAGAIGFASYKQSQQAKPSLGFESSAVEIPVKPVTSTQTELINPVPTPTAIADHSLSDSSAVDPSQIVKLPEDNTPIPAKNTTVDQTPVSPKVKEAIATDSTIEKQLDALLPAQPTLPLSQPEKKKSVAKKAIKQVAPKVAKESNVQPVPSEEPVTSEQILIYSE